jgi:hypothetical protein
VRWRSFWQDAAVIIIVVTMMMAHPLAFVCDLLGWVR